MQEMPARRVDADHGPQELVIAGDQFGRQQPALHQLVAAIDIGDDGFEQLGALGQAARDGQPLAFVEDHRHMRQRPGPLLALGAVIFAVIDAGIAQVLVGALEAAGQFLAAQLVERRDQRQPARADLPGGIDHLVGNTRQQLVVGDKAGCPALSRLPLIPLIHGEIALADAGGMARGNWREWVRLGEEGLNHGACQDPLSCDF